MEGTWKICSWMTACQSGCPEGISLKIIVPAEGKAHVKDYTFDIIGIEFH